jgi:hypothetical protein
MTRNYGNGWLRVLGLAPVLLVALGASEATPKPRADVFVAPNGNDAWSGTLPAPNAGKTDGPFASIAKAQLAVRERLAAQSGRAVTVMLREGTYYLPLSPTNPGTLKFAAGDSGASNAPVIWANYPGETPIVSGGEPVGEGGLGLKWHNVSGSLWQVQLPSGTLPFEYLFYNGARRLRPRVQSASSSSVGYYMRDGVCYSTQDKKAVGAEQCSVGTYLRMADTVAPTGANAGCPKSTNQSKGKTKCLDRFKYNPEDPIVGWTNLNPSGSTCGGAPNAYPTGDIEVSIIESWTMEMMRVSCVDTANHIIHLTGTMRGLSSAVYEFFGPVPGRRYIVENAKDAFDAALKAGQTGVWFLDRSTPQWTLNYLVNQGENPNADTVVIAQLQPVSPVGGSLLSAADLRYAIFRGITFEVDNFVPGPAGFNEDENSEDTLPEAIDCESCQHVTFEGITVRRTSASGILIASASGTSGAPASNDGIQDSAFYDIGDCGIRIGHRPRGTDQTEYVVHSVTVQNNLVQGYSRVFAGGEGISQANGHDIAYLHNDITDGYHAGISLCWLGCPGNPANGSNLLTQYNHIWNIIQGVTSDGGVVYYNIGSGKSSGTGGKVLNNLIHDATDSSIIDLHGCGGARCPGNGYGARGIYLDARSAGVAVENNVVYNMSEFAAFQNEGLPPDQPPDTFHNNIFAYSTRAMFAAQNPWSGGCKSPSLRLNITNNIFYFDRDESSDFHVNAGCAWSCGLDYHKFLNFQGNLYWRTDGTFASDKKAFHYGKEPQSGKKCGTTAASWSFLDFSQWQGGRPQGAQMEMREDQGGTVTVDPHFGHTGHASDFLLSKTPLAGFDHTKTNDTIRHAGREHPSIMPPAVPATFPAYSFTSY